MASLHPSHGARIVLSRIDGSADGARYRVEIYEPDGVQHEGEARLVPALGLAWDDTPPAAWIVTFVTRVALGLAKKHAPDASWPRKLTRWREERG